MIFLRLLVFTTVQVLVFSSNKYTETHRDEDNEEIEINSEASTCERKNGCEFEEQKKERKKEETEENLDQEKSTGQKEEQNIKQNEAEQQHELNKQLNDSNDEQKQTEEESKNQEVNLDELKLVRLDGVEVGHVKHLQLKTGGPTYRLITRAIKPLLFEIPNFLSRDECEHIISLALESGLSTSIAGFDPTLFDGDLREALKNKKEEDLKSGKSLVILNKSYHTQVFNYWDADGDGKISLDEMRQLLRRFYLVYLTQDEIKEMFEIIGSDAYDDNDLSREELEEKVDLGQIHVYMNFLRHKHPKHRSRYSEQAWLPQNKRADPVLRELHERIINLTKLPRKIVQGGEALQVVRYGVHGHYHAHYDSSPNKEPGQPCCHQLPDKAECSLCRFITILYYLNDVEEGGETAFLTANNETHNEDLLGRNDYYNLGPNCYKAKLVLPPKRGTAILWYNHFIDESSGFLGERDQHSVHGGCPIWKGSKWIANNWINGPRLDSAHIKSVYEDYGWD